MNHHAPMIQSRLLRQVLADRLRDLMASRPDLDTQVKLARRASLSQSAVARILSADTSATTDSIADLARAFGTSPASGQIQTAVRGIEPEHADLVLERLDEIRASLQAWADAAQAPHPPVLGVAPALLTAGFPCRQISVFG